jgi:DNA-binding HxlR family transcriptional regulator
MSWFSDRRLQKAGNEVYLPAIEKVEDVFSNKGAVRILILMRYYGKCLRYTQLREVCELPVNTLNHTLNRLIEKKLVERTYADVTVPKKQKKVTHYGLTQEGKKFHDLVLNRKISEFIDGGYEPRKLNKLWKKRKES